MLIALPDILTAAQVKDFQHALEGATWVDGRATAGYQAAPVKANKQLAEDDPKSRELGAIVVKALEQASRFISAVLPLKVTPPLFSSYREGETYGLHVDGAIRSVATQRIRTDLAATIFLSPPEDYDGGELIVEHTYGVQSLKLPAGHAILYPASSLHRVNPIRRGVRFACIFWVQSLVRDDVQRRILFDIDISVQELRGKEGPTALRLTSAYHNLLRMWSDT